MRSLLDLLGGKRDWRIVLTDSGLGGLSICAGLEKRLRNGVRRQAVGLVYVNAWPDAGHGYNDLPDAAARAAVLDRALAAMMGFRPDLIVIACNTLSVLYESTEFARAPAVPVAGIIDEGVDLFAGALQKDPAATLVLFGTRTTIESGEHVRRLTALGIDPRRIRTAACHGLAAVIDKDPDDPALPGLVEECVSRALAGGIPPRDASTPAWPAPTTPMSPTFSGPSLAAGSPAAGPTSSIPTSRLVDVAGRRDGPRPRGLARSDLAAEVVSKVELPEAQRRAVARRLEACPPRPPGP